MDCCSKEYAEDCEIFVCVDAPAPHNPDLYSRLRFGLLASSWLPTPLGIFLWSALHVTLLIVGGPAIWVFGLFSAFIFYAVFVFLQVTILYIGFYMVAGLTALAFDAILLLGRSIRFCWSSLVGFLACHEPILECKIGGDWLTVDFWKNFKCVMRDMFWGVVPIGVPCMRGSLYRETKNQMLETWGRWWEEVVHTHDAIAL